MKTETLDYQGMVAEFMKASGQVVNTAPTEMTTELAHLRYNLFIEEVQELKDAVEANDRVEQLDALVDITYILCGTANTIGSPLNDAVGEVYKDRVHWVYGMYAIDEMLSKSVEEIYSSALCIGRVKAWLGFTQETFNEAFHRVHVSNMSKFCRTEQEARETIDSYTRNGVDVFWVQIEGWYVVLRRSDNKVMKSINYSPVDLTDLV